jgi:hypothetical protein
MEKSGATSGVPYVDPLERARLPVLPSVGLSSTYMVSAQKRMPKVAGVGPWVNGDNWVTDMLRLIFSNVKKGMHYTFATKAKDV